MGVLPGDGRSVVALVACPASFPLAGHVCDHGCRTDIIMPVATENGWAMKRLFGWILLFLKACITELSIPLRKVSNWIFAVSLVAALFAGEYLTDHAGLPLWKSSLVLGVIALVVAFIWAYFEIKRSAR